MENILLPVGFLRGTCIDMKLFVRNLLGLALFALTLPGQAAIVFNEFFVDPPGGTAVPDDGREYFELRSTDGGVESMSGLTLVYLDGDGGNVGGIEMAINLSTFSTGTNGLFLWRDRNDLFPNLSPAPDPATTIHVQNFPSIGDLKNGSFTVLLVRGFLDTATDVDSNDDGILDLVRPWTEVIDALGFIENDGPQNVAYAAQVSGTNIGPLAFNPDAFTRDSVTGLWLAGNVSGTDPGPYAYIPGESTFSPFANSILTPGGVNIPEPTTALAIAVGLGSLLFSRRRLTA
jgi:hypothetical protein